MQQPEKQVDIENKQELADFYAVEPVTPATPPDAAANSEEKKKSHASGSMFPDTIHKQWFHDTESFLTFTTWSQYVTTQREWDDTKAAIETLFYTTSLDLSDHNKLDLRNDILTLDKLVSVALIVPTNYQNADFVRAGQNILNDIAALHKRCRSDAKAKLLQDRLHTFRQRCEDHTKYHLGYPYNLNCAQYRVMAPFLEFFLNNLGDAFVQSNYRTDAREFEQEVLNFFAKMWKIEPEDAWGYVTSCGTEGNLLGILYGREAMGGDPILFTSRDAHYSIHKSSRMYKMRFHAVASDARGELDYDAFERDIKSYVSANKNQKFLVNANVGTTVTGAHDKVKQIIARLQKNGVPRENYYIHCDSALSGCFLPLLDEAHEYAFGFDVGVDSISVSGHKFLGTPLPCGIVMTRREHMERWSSAVEYLNSIDTTITGSRSGLASLSLWYTISHQGYDGLRRDCEVCIEMCDRFIALLKSKGIDAWRNPYSITVLFPRPVPEVVAKYQLACQESLAHVVVTPSVQFSVLEEFVREYEIDPTKVPSAAK